MRRSPARRLLPWLLSILAVLLAVVLVLSWTRYYWPQQLFNYYLHPWSSEAIHDKSVGLPDFHVVIDAKPVVGVPDNLSGITWDADRGRLLAVVNKGDMELVALSKTGDLLERYPLQGFDDVEGVAYMGNGWVALVEEQLQQVRFVRVPEQPGPISASEAPYIALGINLSTHNKGFEGLTYDRRHDRIYLAKERDPRQLYEVSGAMASLQSGKLQVKVRDLTSWITRSVFGKDLSDLYYDPTTDHLVLLSDESRLLVELNESGDYVSFRSLLGGISDLKRSTPQPEGVAMDDSGTLYVVSEPNLFYAFQKKK